MTSTELNRPVNASAGEEGWGVVDTVLEGLARQGRSALTECSAGLFANLAGSSADSLILFGAGPLGKFTLAGLRRAGVEPKAFTDNNPELWNQSVDNLRVMPPAQAAEQYGERAAFVVTIYNGSGVRRQLRDLGCRAVIPFAALFWRYSDIFIPDSGLQLPQTILQSSSEIDACYEILADDLSRRELREQIKWRCTLDFDVLSPPSSPRNIYFEPDLIRYRDDEVLIDCGAFDGDTVRSFLGLPERKFKHVYAAEPDPANRIAFQNFVGGLPDMVRRCITLWPYAIGKQDGKVGFRVTSTAASRIDKSDYYEVECRSLDSLLQERGLTPTYIKMDIEGAEPAAIEGAAETLRNAMPVLSACLYHRCEHLWQIPLLISRLAPEYKLFIRRYAEECWELVCYAVPVSRLA
ncbi:MAG TPA: FkbM family methyltransferase [Terriglobales bacterium]|nr:FkbM family methyltransferase [Terriglobales bacterium]